MHKIFAKNTNAQIVVIPSIAPTNEINELKQYYERVEKMREVCEINRVYFLGAGSGIGHARITVDKSYTVDNIHQTDLGGYNFARFIWSQLKNVPFWYTEIPEEDRL